MQKIAFHLGSFSVHWYGVLVAIGFLAGLWTASRRGLREGFVPDKILDLGLLLIGSSILGARTLFVVSYWHEYFANGPWWEIFMIQHGGLVYYGGLIGASLGIIFYTRWKKMPLWKLADVLAPSIPLGYVFGRLGCLVNGCCYGRACDLPWAFRYPAGYDIAGHSLHPTQIYDSLLSLGLYGALAWLYRRKKFDGQVFAAYLICYAFTRSLVESFRGDYTPAHLLGPLTPAHLVSIGVLAAGVILYLKLPRRPGPAPRK